MIDQSMADSGNEVCLADPRWTEEQDVGALLQPDIAFDERGNVRRRHRRHGSEVEAGKRFLRWQGGFQPMPRKPSCLAFGHFMFKQDREQSVGPPSFSIRLFGDLR